MADSFTPVTRPLLPPLEEFTPYLEQIWASQQLTNGGPFHAQLEAELARYLSVEHLSLFANGTLALVTALQALRITGEVITTPYTFVATAHALTWNGIKPVFVDIDPDTLNLDPQKIEAAITPQTTAILPVHCYGHPCDVKAIQAVADNYGLKVIYDAAHAFGVRNNGESILHHGDLSCLSFHATKVFNTFEGGAIVSPDARTKRRIDHLKNFGFVDEVTVVAAGINGKMSEINAAFGLLQLRHIDAALAARASIDARYRARLADVAGISCVEGREQQPNRAYFPILIGPEYPLSRDDLYDRFRERNIHARRYFYPLASSFSMYRGLPSATVENLPVAHRVADQVLCLPIYPTLSLQMQDEILDLILRPHTAHLSERPTQAVPGEPPGAVVDCKLTLAIPAYKARFLDEALRSALAQDFDDYEILICDDCRTDAVAQVVAPYLDAPNGPPLRYTHNAEQLGERGNFAKCLKLARGRYLKFLCDDDLLLPGTLAAQAAVLDAQSAIALVASRRTQIDENGNPLPDSILTRSWFDNDVCVHGLDLVSFLADNILNFIGEPSGVMFRRELLLPLSSDPMALDGQPIEWLGDLTMYVNMMRQGHLAILEQPGASFRFSSEQVSHTSRSTPGIGHKGYADFSRLIRQLGWYREADNHLVRVAPLASPDEFQEIDLRARLERMLHGEDPHRTLRNWLIARAPSDAQAQRIKAYITQHAYAPRIAILVRDLSGSPAKLAATLESLSPDRCLYDRIQVTVLAKSQASVPVGMRHHVLDQGSDWLAAFNAHAASSASDWLMLVDAGECFTPVGLLVAALELMQADGVRAIYGDELVRADNLGSLAPAFRPDFNLDMLLSFPSTMARHWLFRRDVFLQAGGFDPAMADAPEFDLLLRLIGAEGINGLGHVDEPLLTTDNPMLESRPGEVAALKRHLLDRGYHSAQVQTDAQGHHRVLYGHAEQPLVSIIIPTKDQFLIVQRCVETLIEQTAYRNFELLIVDNASTAKDACIWLDGLEAMGSQQVRVLRYPHPFNYSAMNNMAAREARGDYLVLLNNDTAVLQGDWLDAMLNHAQRPEVGIVGAKLLFPNRSVQHAGVVLGLRGPADHPFMGQPSDAPGYMHRLLVDQNYNAVTAACLMIRRSVYEEAGGLDEQAFKVSYNDVDLCLKVRQLGYLITWTPHALLLHEGSISQKQVDTAAIEAKRQRFKAEQDACYARWLPVIARDTAYNTHLSLAGAGFEPDIHTQRDWLRLQAPSAPCILAFAADNSGCGQYRVLQPARAIEDAGLASVHCRNAYPTPVEMERLAPESLVLQRQISEAQIAALPGLTQFRQAFKVAELDDYLPNIPMKSVHRQDMPQDILRSLRRTVGLADRFVVSTDALAEALSDLHLHTRVVQNRLPPNWWGSLAPSLRRQGQRPRVGWAGGSSHQGDLELIADVVKALADEVDWVFFGMCPTAMRPYVHEFHAPVAIDQYPQALARLHLDVALAPLEVNLFNECKSNLRLLEYGVCGYPVICSDVRPYRGSLPVTRVKNRFKDWVDAIRAHTCDLDAAAQAGDRLRAAVQADWMLEGRHAQDWLRAWLPD